MERLPEYLILDPRMDRMPRPALKEMQSTRLRAMVSYCYAQAPFWRRKFDEVGLKPQDIQSIDDLPKVPFCTKAELQADQQAHPPFGSYVATPPTVWARYAATSGTTGVPLKRVLSARDFRNIVDRFRRNPTAGPGDIAVVLGPVDGLIGPMISSESLAAVGVLVVQAGLYDTRTKIKLIRDLKPAIVSGTTSYLVHMLEVAAEIGVDLKSLGIRSLSAIGEPGVAYEETRGRLMRGWNVKRVADGYGMTEIFPLGGNCPHSSALHIASDIVATEIVDPDSGTPLAPGEAGEVVITNLIGDTQPLLRYRSRDISMLATTEACACGFTGARLEGSILGRVDDMIWLRGANVFPSAIETVVRRFAELSPEYQIEITGEASLAALTVRVEALERGIPASAAAALRQRLAGELRESIRVTAEVQIVDPGTLPRPEGAKKMRRVIDKRTA